jgi:hypothetical protein
VRAPEDAAVTVVEKQWMQLAVDKVCALVDLQLKRFRDDLLGSGRGNKKVLRHMLASFFVHVVKTAKVAADDDARRRITALVRELDRRVASLGALEAHGTSMRLDAAQLGQALANAFQAMREHEADVAADLGRVLLPPRPELNMLLLPTNALVLFKPEDHQFALGLPDQLPGLLAQLEANFGLVPARREHTPSLFVAVSRVLYAHDDGAADRSVFGACAGGVIGRGEGERALMLRKLSFSQMRYFYRGGKAARLEDIVGEPAIDYLSRVSAGDFAGDLLCLWFLADYLKLRFRVWIPGVCTRPVLVPYTNDACGALEAATDAYHLVVVAGAREGAGKSVGLRAAEHAPLFVALQRPAFSPCREKAVDQRRDPAAAGGGSSAPNGQAQDSARVRSQPTGGATAKVGGGKRPRID